MENIQYFLKTLLEVLMAFFPLTLALNSYLLFSKTRLLSTRGIIEKMLISLGLGIGLYVLITSWLIFVKSFILKDMLFLNNFRLIYQVIYCLSWIPSLMSFRKVVRVRNFYVYVKNIDINTKIILFGIAVLLIKVVMLYIIQPVTDADVIGTYLPYAKTVLESNDLPLRDEYTKEIVTVPPFGGITLFVNYFALLSSNTEIFKYLTLPFLIGIAAITYLLALLFLNRFYSLISVFVFLSLPIIDQLINRWRLYPDLIFVFLGLLTLYLIVQKVAKKQDTIFLSEYVTVAVLLSSALLLKGQGLYTIYVIFFIILGIILKPIFTRISKINFLYKFTFSILGFSLILIPWMKSDLLRFGFEKPNSFFDYLFTALIYLGSILIYLRNFRPLTTNIKVNLLVKKVIVMVVISIAILLVGSMWFLRNYLEFRGIISPTFTNTVLQQYINTIKDSNISDVPYNYDAVPLLIYWIVPFFGTFWFLIKFAGIIVKDIEEHSLSKKKIVSLYIFWIVYWYVVGIWHLGGVNERYLFISIPILSIIIVYGLLKLSRYLQILELKIDMSHFVLTYVIIQGYLSLIQSELITWLMASSLFSPGELRNVVVKGGSLNANISNFQLSGTYLNNIGGLVVRYSDGIFDQFIKITTLVNVLTININKTVAIQLINISAVMTVLSIITVLIILRSRFIRIIQVTLSLGLLLIYVYLIYKIGVKAYPQYYKQQIYSYWGESNNVVPHLKEHGQEEDVVLVFGPKTGLAYQTGLVVINMSTGYGNTYFDDTLFTNNKIVLLEYLKSQKIKFVVIFNDQATKDLLLYGKDRGLALFDIIDDSEYSDHQVINDNNYNLWDVYKLKI